MVGLVLAALASACSDSGDSKGVPGTGDPTDTVASSGEFAAVDVPAGVNWQLSSTLQAPADEGGSGVPLPSFAQVTATAGVPAAPAGYPFRQADYISDVFEVGGVQLAVGTCSCWQGGSAAGVSGGLRTPIYLFRSADSGATWNQVNLGAVLGDVNGYVRSIIEHDGAMILTAVTTDAAAATPNVINVLQSSDGNTWKSLATIASDAAAPVALHAFATYALGSSLVIYGADTACEFDGSSAVQNIGPSYQTRFWTSTDGGTTWQAQAASDTGLDVDRAALPDAATCAGLDIESTIQQFESRPRLVDSTDDRLMVWSHDGGEIVSTTDGVAWEAVPLDGGVPVPADGVEVNEPSSSAAAILTVDGQLMALNLEDYRYFDDTTSGSDVGLSIVTWTSADGATWQRQPLGRPLLNPDYTARYEFFATDGRIGLRAYDIHDNSDIALYESIAGVSEDWRSCVPAPEANCAFATDVGAFEPGADLSGIDLSYASLEGRDLTGVSFAGAILQSTNTIGATIANTNFDGAELKYVTLEGDLTTSSFDGATLTSVSFDDSFFSTVLPGATIVSPTIQIRDSGLPAGVSLSGRDLSGYSFNGGTLAGVDFSGSDLSGASFGYTDLTGADFTGATLDGVFFFEVTCPDGQPPAEDAFGPERCRL